MSEIDSTAPVEPTPDGSAGEQPPVTGPVGSEPATGEDEVTFVATASLDAYDALVEAEVAAQASRIEAEALYGATQAPAADAPTAEDFRAVFDSDAGTAAGSVIATALDAEGAAPLTEEMLDEAWNGDTPAAPSGVVSSGDLDRGHVVGRPVHAVGNPGGSVKVFHHRGRELVIDMVTTSKSEAIARANAWRAAIDAELGAD